MPIDKSVCIVVDTKFRGKHPSITLDEDNSVGRPFSYRKDVLEKTIRSPLLREHPTKLKKRFWPFKRRLKIACEH